MIEKIGGERNSRWHITKKGIERLLKRKRTLSLRGMARRYESGADTSLKIIAFDIPEAYRGKRDWLREALRCLGFRLLQRSVWYGKRKIPESFLRDLRKHGLLRYVHIFLIEKAGTVRIVG